MFFCATIHTGQIQAEDLFLKCKSRTDNSTRGPGSVVGIATAYVVERSGDRIPVGARLSAPVQTDPEAHPASCTKGTGSFSGGGGGRGVTLTTHPPLVPRS